jgi:hypothetical protein
MRNNILVVKMHLRLNYFSDMHARRQGEVRDNLGAGPPEIQIFLCLCLVNPVWGWGMETTSGEGFSQIV